MLQPTLLRRPLRPTLLPRRLRRGQQRLQLPQRRAQSAQAHAHLMQVFGRAVAVRDLAGVAEHLRHAIGDDGAQGRRAVRSGRRVAADLGPPPR